MPRPCGWAMPPQDRRLRSRGDEIGNRRCSSHTDTAVEGRAVEGKIKQAEAYKARDVWRSRFGSTRPPLVDEVIGPKLRESPILGNSTGINTRQMAFCEQMIASRLISPEVSLIRAVRFGKLVLTHLEN